MAVKASDTVTIVRVVDIDATYRYYYRTTSLTTPVIDNTSVRPPTTGGTAWSLTEPAYSGGTYYLYFTDCTVYTNGAISYSSVSLSSSYEAAKAAYNLAENARTTAINAAKTATNYLVYDSTNGLKVTDNTQDPKNYVNINTDGMSVYKNAKKIAEFKGNVSLRDDAEIEFFRVEKHNSGYQISEQIVNHPGYLISSIAQGHSHNIQFGAYPDDDESITISVKVDCDHGELTGSLTIPEFYEECELIIQDDDDVNICRVLMTYMSGGELEMSVTYYSVSLTWCDFYASATYYSEDYISKTIVNAYANDESVFAPFIVGNGNEDYPSNAFAVAGIGEGRFKGNVRVYCNDDSSGGEEVLTNYISLSDCCIEDSGTALSVTSGANTTDGLLASAIIAAFSYSIAVDIFELT